jgi:hypothetical protein
MSNEFVFHDSTSIKCEKLILQIVTNDGMMYLLHEYPKLEQQEHNQEGHDIH